MTTYTKNTLGHLLECDDSNAFKILHDSEIPKLESRPRLLWHHNFYDGPLSGICLYQNKEHWFQMVDEIPFKEDDDYRLGRVFVIVELTPEDIKIESSNHNEFRKFVGTHADYDENNERVHGGPPTWWFARIFNRIACILGVYTRASDLYFYGMRLPWQREKQKLRQQRIHHYNDYQVVAWWSSSVMNFDAYIMSAMQEEGAIS
jgi:hypothetical protein